MRMKSHEPLDSKPSKQITVLLVDDYADFRRSLKVLAEANGDIKVVAPGQKTALKPFVSSNGCIPMVVVMDIAMPLMNGLQGDRQIMGIAPLTRVLILSAHPDPEYVKQAMLFGASGYLLKQSLTEFLDEAIREVRAGNSYFSNVLPKSLRDQCRKQFSKNELLKKRASSAKPPKTSSGKCSLGATWVYFEDASRVKMLRG